MKRMAGEADDDAVNGHVLAAEWVSVPIQLPPHNVLREVGSLSHDEMRAGLLPSGINSPACDPEYEP